MENNEQTYCYINVKEVPNFYNSFINRINSSKYLTVANIGGQNCLCFIMDNHNKNDKSLNFDFENQVYPFIFLNDKLNKMFVDIVTNRAYFYNAVNKGVGDYIEEVIPSGINLSNEDVKKYVNTIPFVRYKEIIEEFEKIMKESYCLDMGIDRANR
ncbi:MAG: hypothetical protein IKX00_02295 [Bacilli bacterium]|nr:hypothetical protein [Bacilli bacterium]